MFEKEAEKYYTYLKAKGITSYSVRRFRTIIYRFYKQNTRDSLPWRQTDNPYNILVSEIMLQQTQIERVLKKYPVFIKRYPDFGALAKASPGSLYRVWQGMGYNRRALALKEIASKIVRSPYNGRLPSNVEELMELPFIGQSSAGAVSAFAFHKPSVFIETNIRRVVIHFFFREQDKVRDSDILPLIARTLDKKDPRNWYYALMDYGSALRSLKYNPNLKSRTYKKQSPFAGSTRQIRGRILRAVSNEQGITEKKLSESLHAPRDKVQDMINQLCREGFINKKGSRITMG
jgi:A/G-specific adenine glycosylase